MDKKKPNKKSAHLQDLERSFDRQTRRFSAFQMLGLEQPAETNHVAAPGAEGQPSSSSQPPTSPKSSEVVTPEPLATAGATPIKGELTSQSPGLAGTSPDIAEQVYSLPLGRLIPSPDQPRLTEDPEADQELLESIRLQGVITPIHVRPVGDQFEVVAGERRWRACKLLGKETIPALIRTSSKDQAAAQALIDNLVRKDLSALEEAKAFKALIERHGYLQAQLADQVGCHKSRISVALSILKLPPAILDLLFGPGSGMTTRHAQALLPLLDQPARLARIAQQAVKEGWTSEQVRAEVSRKPRVNAGAQAVRFQVRGENAERGFLLQIRFHPNRPYDVPMIEDALAKASSLIRQNAGQS
jgi:ParB family chromosome partitioning protein